MTDLWKQGREPLQGFKIIRLGLNPEREFLYQRINRRAQKMFEDGLVEETQTLVTKYGDSCWALGSLGYKQSDQLLRGEINWEAAITAAQQSHRNYAKRQMTWFHREPDVTWIAGFGDDAAIQQQAIDRVNQEAKMLSSAKPQ
ncbi:MAG TPA: tRNA dimethylallyltransferase, partial [Terriglobales bacterium]